MVLNDQEQLDNEAAGQILPSNWSVDETDEWEVNQAYPAALCEWVLAGECFKELLKLPR